MYKTAAERAKEALTPVLLEYKTFLEIMEIPRLSRPPLYYELRNGVGFWAVGFDQELVDAMREKGITGTFAYNRDYRCWTEQPTKEERIAKKDLWGK